MDILAGTINAEMQDKSILFYITLIAPLLEILKGRAISLLFVQYAYAFPDWGGGRGKMPTIELGTRGIESLARSPRRYLLPPPLPMLPMLTQFI